MIKKGMVYAVRIKNVHTVFIVRSVGEKVVYTDHAVTSVDGGYTWSKSRTLLKKHICEPIKDITPVLDAYYFDKLYDAYPDKSLYKNVSFPVEPCTADLEFEIKGRAWPT